MEGLKRELKMLETVERQILGALHKIKCARCKSIRIKLEVLEKELNDLNHLKEKNQQLTTK